MRGRCCARSSASRRGHCARHSRRSPGRRANHALRISTSKKEPGESAMLQMSRRDFVVSTALAGALGLNARLVTPAFAQKTPDPAKGFVTYKIGSAEVTALYDGIWEKPHDAGFIANASIDDVKAAMVKAGLPADFVSIPFTVVVIKTGGKTVMCDSGTGGQVQPTAGKLAANMKAAGIDPPKIDTILISHFHPDHIFGLMEKDTNKALYPNAGIIVSDAEY